jgi:hypothetical protein
MRREISGVDEPAELAEEVDGQAAILDQDDGPSPLLAAARMLVSAGGYGACGVACEGATGALACMGDGPGGRSSA